MIHDFGGGASTGMDQTAIGKIATGLAPGDLVPSNEDREILRRLAGRFAELAQSPAMADKRKLWSGINRLRPGRPLIFCDPEMGWNEIITERQMKCRGQVARAWEMHLRKEIFWQEEMGDDKPIDPFFDVPYTTAPDDWGMETKYIRTERMGSMKWDAPIKDYGRDLPRLQIPRVEIDWETTNGCLELARDLFAGTLPVRLKGIWWWSLGITQPAVFLRGLSNILYDFIERPDELKALLAFIGRAHLAKLDYLEEHNLLSLNNDSTYVGSGGLGNTDELPARDYSGRVRCADLWGFTDSQETVNVSPRMYEEFVFPFEKPIMDRFGLTCYGCCEHLHNRFSIVRKHHNLRRVSCSPWVDHRKMAAQIEDKFIYSMKPSPSPLAAPKLDQDLVRRSLREALEITRGCVVEIIMKDNHTIGGRPENLTEWCRIAREEAERVA
jgi:hypothetical protein